MSRGWTPAEVLGNPQSESLIEEMKHWNIVKTDDKGNVKLVKKAEK